MGFTSASITEGGVGLGGMARSLTGSAVGPKVRVRGRARDRVRVRVRIQVS